MQRNWSTTGGECGGGGSELSGERGSVGGFAENGCNGDRDGDVDGDGRVQLGSGAFGERTVFRFDCKFRAGDDCGGLHIQQGTLTASAQAVAGVAGVTITAMGGGMTRTMPVTVTVTSACSYAIDPGSASVSAAAGNYSVKVTATPGCTWTASAGNSNWLTVTSGASGFGSGTVNYSVAANTATTTRSGAIAIAGLSLAVMQAAAAPQISLKPSSASFTAAAGTGTIAVSSTSATVGWTVVSNTSWIRVTSGSPGVGSKPVAYAVAANPAAGLRTGTMTIGGATFTVTQAGVRCTYSLGVASQTTSATGLLMSFPVTAPAGCSWYGHQ